MRRVLTGIGLIPTFMAGVLIVYFLIYTCDVRYLSLLISGVLSLLLCIKIYSLRSERTRTSVILAGACVLFVLLFLLSATNSARSKSIDASIMQGLNNLRGVAELYYEDNKESYSGLCQSDSAFVEAGQLVLRAESDRDGWLYSCNGYIWYYLDQLISGTDEYQGEFACTDSETTYRVAGTLPNMTMRDEAVHWYCVDSNGTTESLAEVGDTLAMCRN